MVRTPRHQVAIRRPPHGRTVNIVFSPGNGRHRGGDDHRILIGRPRNMISSATWNGILSIMFGLLGLLVGLIQIKYMNQTKSAPFETHPTIWKIAITALCACAVAAATATLVKSMASKEVEQQPNTNSYRILNILGLGLDILCLISALVTISCIVFILIPDGPGWIVFVASATIFFALIVALIFFGPTNSGQGAARPNMV